MVMLDSEIRLPAQREVSILTTADPSWLPRVAEVVIRPDKYGLKTVLLQSGDGPYVLGIGYYVGKSGPEIQRLINHQKGRPLDQLIALGIPRVEMSLWVAPSQRPLVEKLVSVLRNEVFGVIAQANPILPDWMTNFDIFHGVREKLMVWCDKTDTGPTAQLFTYIRNELRLPPDEFTMLFTSANLHRRGTQTRFAGAYKQLGDKDDIAYAVMDVHEDEYQKGSPPIISMLPFTIGHNRLLALKARRGTDDLQLRLTELEVRSKFGMIAYSIGVVGHRFLHPRAA